MNYRTLGNTGLDVSVLSFGASSLGSVFREVKKEEAIKTVHTAVDMGINLIDVSPYYGLTKAEEVLGKAIKTINRDRFFLSSKAGRYGEDEFNFTKKSILRSVEESLKRLNTDYLDVLFLHDIEFGSFQEVIEEGIPALQELKADGKIRYYGVSGLPLSIFEETLGEVDLDVILSYCHYSLNNTSLLNLLPLLKQKQVGLMNASPLSMGLLTERGAPAWHPASEEIKRTCQKAALYCKEHGTDISKLAIQFAVAHEQIPTTLVSTANPKNIQKNIEYINEPIDKELLEGVLEILAPIHSKMWNKND